MKVFINRESPIPLHDQLVTQISLLIAAGVLAPGSRLPSVRDLASRIDVHRNTVMAVYNTLESYGVVTIKAGSGVRVLEPKSPGAPSGWRGGVALGHMAARFIAEAREQGHTDAALREAFELAMAPRPMRRIVVVDPHADFHPLYRRELGAVFAIPVETLTLDGVRAIGPDGLDDAALLTSMYHLQPLREVVGDDRPVVVVPVDAGESVLQKLRALPTGATVGLVTVSETLLRMAKEILAGVRGEDLLVIEADPADAERLRSLLRLSDLVVVDSASHEAVLGHTPRPVVRFKLLPDAALSSVAQQLPPEAFVAAIAP
jgi:GntR family transcriptional regulator